MRLSECGGVLLLVWLLGLGGSTSPLLLGLTGVGSTVDEPRWAAEAIESNATASWRAMEGQLIPLLEHAHLWLFAIYSVFWAVLYFRASGSLRAIPTPGGPSSD